MTRNTAKSYKACEYNVFQPLQSCFLSQEVRTNYLERLKALFADPMTEVFPFSYQYTFQSFVNFNKHFQREEPLLSRLQDQIQQFLKRIPFKFLRIVFVASRDMFSDAWREHENQKSGSFNL